jgi:hypothetical protein
MADSYPAINGTGLVTTGAAQTISGAKTFLAGSATSVPVTIKAASGQTANLFEVQTNAGTNELALRAGGALGVNFLDRVDATGSYIDMRTAVTGVRAVVRTASHPGLVVIGAASQTGNLQEWQDSAGTVLTRVRSTGTAEFNYGLYTQGPINNVPLSGHIQIDNTAANGTVDSKGLLVRARSGQTANLIEWQNSAGTGLGSVYRDGTGIFPSLNVGTFLIDTGSAYTASIQPTAASKSGLLIRGQASQSVELMVVQDSAGTFLSGFDSGGLLKMSAGVVGGTAVGSYWGYGQINIAGVGVKKIQLFN